MSRKVDEFNSMMDNMLERNRSDDNFVIHDYLPKLSQLMDGMTESELREIYFRNNKEYQVLVHAAKLLPSGHPNREYIIKLYMNKYLDMMLMQNKNIKDALDNGDLSAEQLFKEMELYDQLKYRDQIVTKGEETFRKSRKKIQAKSRKREQKITGKLNSIGAQTNKINARLVKNINGLQYNKK